MKKIFLIMLLLVSGAVAVSCQDMAEEGRYADAGDCYMEKEQYVDAGDAYSEAEQWNDCLNSYLRAARKAEKDYLPLDEEGERYIGDTSDRTISLYYYNPSTAKVNTCLSNSDHSDLRSKMDQYYNWIQYYPTNPVEPPFDIQTEVISEVSGESKECEELYYFDETMEECDYKEFCGLYMYEGLRTFETESECQKALKEFLGDETQEGSQEEEETGEVNKTEPVKDETPDTGNETTGQEGDGDVLLLLGAALGAIALIILAAVVIFFMNKGKEDVFVCSECGEEFDSERGLHVHMGKKHKED